MNFMRSPRDFIFDQRIVEYFLQNPQWISHPNSEIHTTYMISDNSFIPVHSCLTDSVKLIMKVLDTSKEPIMRRICILLDTPILNFSESRHVWIHQFLRCYVL